MPPLRLRLIATTVLLFPALSLFAQPTFEAGAAKRLITPNPLLPLSGGMGLPKPPKGKQGDLMARAVVYRSGNELLAIATVDLLGFPSVLGDRARRLVPRIPGDRIWIAATHNHSGPDSYAYPDGKGGHTANLEYLQFVSEQVAAALNEAFDKLQPAELRLGTANAEGRIAYNYYAPDLYDRRVSVQQVRARGGDNHIISTLVNYAVHPEVMGSEQGILSPDLVGPLCDAIEKQTGGTALFVNSAQGGMVTADNRDLNSPKDPARAYWNDRREWSECERIGGLLAKESLRAIDKAAWQQTPPLKVWSTQAKFRVDSDDLWAVVVYSPLKYPHNPDRTITTTIGFAKLANASMLTIPGEALPNIGFYLKRKMGAEHNFLFGLTNDAFGYILTKVDFHSFPRYDYVSRVSLGEMSGETLVDYALKLFAQANQ